jgi:hypothetical protein
MIWRIDGTRHGGPRGDWHAFGWSEFTKAKTPRNVRKGKDFIEIGTWRLADYDNFYLVLASAGSADQFRADGNREDNFF